MEQYWIKKEEDFKSLRFCLNNYDPLSLFIRLKGSYGGGVKVNENLKGRSLDFKNKKNELIFFIDSKKIINLDLEDYYNFQSKGFSVAYERLENYEFQGKIYKRPLILKGGDDPYSSFLPPPNISTLRQIFDSHLVEITFSGRIELEFDSWWHKPHLKFWKIVSPKL